MGLEFGFYDYEGISESVEKYKSQFEELDSLTDRLLLKNQAKLEFSNELSKLSHDIELSQGQELLNSKFQETSTSKKLEELRKRCSKAKSLDDIKRIREEYGKLFPTTQKQLSSVADELTSNSVKAGIAKEGILSEVTKMSDSAIKPASGSSQIVKKSNAEIMHEAYTRTKAEYVSELTAQKAQKFYSSLSDATTGKSAKESADVFQEALSKEAQARANKQKIAEEVAENAQKYYSKISDSTIGKSAQESAQVFKEAFVKQEAQQRTKTQELAEQVAKQAQTYYSKISDATTGKSASESAQVFQEAFEKKQNVIGKSLKKISSTIKNASKRIFKKVNKTNIKDKFSNLSKKFKTKFFVPIILAFALLLGKPNKKENTEQ